MPTEEKMEKSVGALLIIDMQYDFMNIEGRKGSLAVLGADKLIPVINDLRKKFETELVVYSQDWHPQNHCSYASNNHCNCFIEITLPSGAKQMMWPDHCIQGSKGAEIVKDLLPKPSEKIVFKGENPAVDSYSAFADNDGKSETSLNKILQDHGVTEVYVCGVATDYCVNYTCQHAIERNYQTFLVTDACAGVNPDTVKQALSDLAAKGVIFVKSQNVKSLTAAVSDDSSEEDHIADSIGLNLKNAKPVKFQFHAPAWVKEAQIAGYFNQWKGEVFESVGNGVFEHTVKLAPGHHEYKYKVRPAHENGLIDEHYGWIYDHEKPHHMDRSGHVNNYINVQ